MADLIDQADVVARMGALNASQLARVDALIADASALAISEAPGLGAVTNETLVLRLNGERLILPAPVSAITSVHQVANPTDLLVPSTCWTFDGIDTITLGLGSWAVINLPESWWDDDGSVGTYKVACSIGSATVPADVVAVVANMVIRVLTAPSMVEGLTGENIGQYGYQMSQQSGSPGAGVRLTQADRAVLRRYRRTAQTVETPL